MLCHAAVHSLHTHTPTPIRLPPDHTRPHPHVDHAPVTSSCNHPQQVPSIRKGDLQLVGVGALLIASKLEVRTRIAVTVRLTGCVGCVGDWLEDRD